MKNSKKMIPFQNSADMRIQEALHDGITLNGRIEDGATVISARFKINAPKAEVEEILSQELKDLAAKVYENGGIIGHIKASAEIQSMQMYSITDTILHVKNGECDEITITFAFILFLVDVEIAQNWTRQIIERMRAAAEKDWHLDRCQS